MRKFISKNPLNGKQLAEFPFATNEQLNVLLQQSQVGYRRIQKQSFKDRSKQLVRLSEIIYNNCDKYAKLITTEMGKPYAQSLAEVKKSAAYCQYYAENGEKFIKQQRIKTEAHHSYVKYEPIGSIYVISPFNFPFWLCFKPIISQLALGNAVIHRPSDSTPLTGLALEELFKESGFNGNEFLNVFSSHDQLERIVSGCEGVSFTGSSRGGKAIGEIAGRYLKRSVLELGGSDPLMLMLEGNIDKAVDVAIRSRITNCGQVCFSAKRYLIHEVHYDKFKTRLLDRLSKLKIGDPMDETTEMGPMARMDLVEQLHQQIQKSIDQGGNLLTGGVLKKQSGFFYPPTVIEVNQDNILAQEETFGPLFTLIKCQDNQHIIDLANRTQFGLGAVLISDDHEQIPNQIDKLNCGMVFVNEPVKSDARLPSGGTKQSGFGRECGYWGMMNFANVKTVWIA